MPSLRSSVRTTRSHKSLSLSDVRLSKKEVAKRRDSIHSNKSAKNRSISAKKIKSLNNTPIKRRLDESGDESASPTSTRLIRRNPSRISISSGSPELDFSQNTLRRRTKTSTTSLKAITWENITPKKIQNSQTNLSRRPNKFQTPEMQCTNKEPPPIRSKPKRTKHFSFCDAPTSQSFVTPENSKLSLSKSLSTPTHYKNKNNASDTKTSKKIPKNYSPRKTRSLRRKEVEKDSNDSKRLRCADVLDDTALPHVLAEMGFNSMPAEQSNRNGRNQWLQFGRFVRFRPLYESAYIEPLNSAPIIYACEFCLTHVLTVEEFKSHVMFCPRRFPPGNEIYRDGRLSIWEVEGNLESTYCRNLCLMAKLFLSSKTLYHEVDTFTFYILTEITTRGFVFVAYFSKEKNPSKNNNLSCLLTLPSAQGKGYGKFLIDLSYQLSKLEHKIGSPEHPLSNMGLLAYRSYWRSVLFVMLRQRKNAQTVSVKDLSIESAIHSNDIIATLLANDMLKSQDDCFYIDITKALNAGPLLLRRRSIRTDLLLWCPPFDPNPHSKMNSYVTID